MGREVLIDFPPCFWYTYCMKAKLKQISENLKKYYHFSFMSPSVVFVREHKSSPVMMQLLLSEDFPNCVLISTSINYSNPPIIAQLVYDIMCQTDIKIAEPFYESDSGQMSYGDIAYESKFLEKNTEFLKKAEAANSHPI